MVEFTDLINKESAVHYEFVSFTLHKAIESNTKEIFQDILLLSDYIFIRKVEMTYLIKYKHYDSIRYTMMKRNTKLEASELSDLLETSDAHYRLE